MNELPANLLYDPTELEKWLDSSPPLSDDDIKSMSAYFDSEHFQFPDDSLFDIINIDKQKNEVTL